MHQSHLQGRGAFLFPSKRVQGRANGVQLVPRGSRFPQAQYSSILMGPSSAVIFSLIVILYFLLSSDLLLLSVDENVYKNLSFTN